MSRPRLYFDGAPNRFTAMRKLFNQQSTLQVRWSTPIDRKFRLWPRRQVTGQRRFRAA